MCVGVCVRVSRCLLCVCAVWMGSSGLFACWCTAVNANRGCTHREVRQCLRLPARAFALKRAYTMVFSSSFSPDSVQQAANAASFALLGQSFQYGPCLRAGFKTLSAIWPEGGYDSS